MAYQGGLNKRTIGFFEQGFQPAGGTRDEKRFDLTHLLYFPMRSRLQANKSLALSAIEPRRYVPLAFAGASLQTRLVMSHLHVHVRRWVVWWIYIGIVCGAIALVNILMRNLTHTQDDVILVLGAVHWLLGGLVCWTFDGVKIVSQAPESRPCPHLEDEKEWHCASEFVLPGTTHSLLPPR